MTKPVLVVGGAGYVGSHTCKALAKAGYTPVTYDSLVHGFDWAVRWGPFEKGDALDRDKVLAVLKKHKPAAVFLFAAFTAVGESVEKPAAYYENNVGGLLSVLSAVRECGIQNVIFSSSAAIYGNPEVALIPEDHPKRPINPYAETKLICEKILDDYSKAYGMRAVSLRYFNAAGADFDGEIGEAHDPETHLVPLALRAVFDPKFTLSIFGTDYETEDGTAVRDYIHVTDLADAHVRALKYLEEGGETTALNLGTGQGYSVRQVADTIEKVLGKKLKQKNAARRPGDPAILVADPGKAKEVLGWQPRYSDLETIIKTAGAWQENRWADKLPAKAVK